MYPLKRVFRSRSMSETKNYCIERTRLVGLVREPARPPESLQRSKLQHAHDCSLRLERYVAMAERKWHRQRSLLAYRVIPSSL
jgi:hypothetical protein